MTNNTILSEHAVSSDPVSQFDTWYREHLSFCDPIPDNVFLGTSSEEGTVSVRTVLLKFYSESGFIFFTNYESRKAWHLSKNSNVALLFYWPEKGRQVRIEGTAEKCSVQISDEYFKSRPRESQISAWASQQSTEIPDREYLDKRFGYYSDLFQGYPVPRPQYWGGYIIIPSWFEFWQDGVNRMHDRIIYRKENDLWLITRLAP